MADAHPKTGASHKRVGSVVRGKYRVEAFLATGTMANVYAATHRNGAKVALKILHGQLAEDPALCERFKREGYFANSIGHPGIVRAIDDDVTEDGCPFMVMELLDGETLEERRRRKGGKLPLSWVLPVADSLLDILAAAHARDVVHRDLKPDNVFVTKSGDVKVLDFGVARWNDGKSSSDMTAVGMVLGTPAYMPPEQALGRREDVDAQSDLWAVGATMFLVLSGESVHVGGDAKAKLIATARTAARPLYEAAPEVPRAVAAVIDRALAFHKQERWPDALAMREALRWARMSLDERPSATLAASSDTRLEPIPQPVPTRRTVDDEVTVMRAMPRDDAAVPASAPTSKDVFTSAPPITLRDIPKSTSTGPGSLSPASSLPSDPVFSLRRAKEEMPSTQRIPNADGVVGIPTPKAGSANEAVPHAYSMPTYDPAEAMGDELPMSSEGPGKSVDVNLSFTLPLGGPSLTSSAPPPPQPQPRLGQPRAGQAATLPLHGSSPPPYVHSSAPPAAPPSGGARVQTQTSPSMRVLAEQSSRPSLPPDDPGPMLSQIVTPRGGVARILVPLALALVAVIAVLVVLRTRAANARDAAVGHGVVAATAETPRASAAPGTSGATPEPGAGAPAGTVATSTVANLPDADPKTASSLPDAKKPRPHKKPAKKPVAAAKPAEPAEDPPTTAAPETTSTAAPTPAPTATTPAADPTPRDSLPSKDPEPKPAPVAPAAPAETPGP